MIHVKMFTGKSIEVIHDFSQTIDYIKSSVQDKEGIPSEYQQYILLINTMFTKRQ